MAAECPAVLGTRWRRLPAVASGNYYYNHYDEVLNGAGSTLTVPGFGLKNGVHPTSPARRTTYRDGLLEGHAGGTQRLMTNEKENA